MKQKQYVSPTSQVVIIEQERAIALSFGDYATQGLGNEMRYVGESEGDGNAGTKQRLEWEEL